MEISQVSLDIYSQGRAKNVSIFIALNIDLTQ